MPSPMGATRSQGLFWLVTGGVIVLACAALLVLSLGLRHGEDFEERPVLETTLLLLAASAAHAVASWRALAAPPPLRVVIPVALLARAALIPSQPIQEDDVYRYIWDGRVGAAGLDPYLSSPAEIDGFLEGTASIDPERAPDLARLAALARRTAASEVIFSRINNRVHATVYPALAQAVFQIHARTVPEEWPPLAQVAAMKAVLAAFDLATLAALILLLLAAGKPPGLSLLYAWCPLVLKEVSNSGHMDSVPAFFLVAALAAVARRRPLLAGLGLGAAIAAKYHAVLALPIAIRALGLRRGLVALAAAAAVMAPALAAWPAGKEMRRESLARFALTWENHDVAFTWIREALGLLPDRVVAVHVPGTDRAVEVPRSRLLALLTAGVAALAILAVAAARTHPRSSAGDVAHRVFIVLAAALLLGPLGFPWYFIPCAALLPFARARSWLLLPGLLMVYYLRFWYQYRFSGGYAGFQSGVDFFDHVVVSAEMAILGLALSMERIRSWRRARERSPGPAPDDS